MPTLSLYIHYTDESDLDWLRNKAEAAIAEVIDENEERFDGDVGYDGWDTQDDD